MVIWSLFLIYRLRLDHSGRSAAYYGNFFKFELHAFDEIMLYINFNGIRVINRIFDVIQ